MLLVVLLVDLRLRHGHRVVRAGRHHGACDGYTLEPAVRFRGRALGPGALGGFGPWRVAIRDSRFGRVRDWRSEWPEQAQAQGKAQSSTCLANGWEGPGARKSGAHPGQEAGVRDDNRTKSQSSHVPMPPRRCGTCCPPALGGACWGVYWRYCGCILAGAGSSLLQCVVRVQIKNRK